eukprot:scaffold99_cov193-Alexandrium_tamarense.AAC.3
MMPVVTEIPHATPSTTHHTLKQHHQLVNGGVSSPTSLLHNINMNSPSPSPLDVTFITSRANTAAPSSASRGAFLKPRAAPQCAPSSFSSRISSQYTSYAETEMEDIIVNTKMISSPRDLISPTTTAIASFESIEYCSEIRPRKSSYDSSNGGAMYRYSSPTKMSGSPANTKLKTEMCRNILKIGYCQFKENCHFAHSKEELRKFETVEEMHEAGLITDPKNYMARPCFFGVSTGSCPYGARCKSLHPPNIQDNEDDLESFSWLDHCTKFKKEGWIIVDRLFHSRMNGIHQQNPLVDSFAWENCRPSLLIESSTDVVGANTEWTDTYKLVCNKDVPIFTPIVKSTAVVQTSISSPMSYLNIANKNIVSPVNKMTDVQKLAIVLAMHRPSSVASAAHESHLDYTCTLTVSNVVPIVASLHCINDQPCMILQERYFRLMEFKQNAIISLSTDIVKELHRNEYEQIKASQPDVVIQASEVVFDSKGKRSANLSIFFDVESQKCSNNKAKKQSSRKGNEENWKLDDKTLFCMPANNWNKSRLPDIVPYVFMQPVNDDEVGLGLVEAILEHQIGSILLSQDSHLDKFPSGKAELDNCMIELEATFARMSANIKRYFWHKTSNMDHISKGQDERCRTVYTPSDNGPVVKALWKSFTTNLSVDEKTDTPFTTKKRLGVFSSIEERESTNSATKNLPHIKHAKPLQKISPKTSLLSEATWKELLEDEVGYNGTGAWSNAIKGYNAQEKNNRPTRSLQVSLPSLPSISALQALAVIQA